MKNGKRYALVALALVAVMLFASCSVGPVSDDDTNGTTSARTTAPATATGEQSSAATASTTASTTAPKPAVNVTGFELTAPEGWTEDTSTKYFWYAPTYPTDPSNMNVQTVPVGSDFEEMMNYTAADLESIYEASFETSFGSEIPVTVLVCERTTVAGFDAMVMALEYELYGMRLFAKQYVVEAGTLGVVFTLTQAGTAEWESAFDACVNGVTWKY